MLKARKGSERVRVIGGGRNASAVLCNRGIFYLSPVDATTLARRAGAIGNYRKCRAQAGIPEADVNSRESK